MTRYGRLKLMGVKVVNRNGEGLFPVLLSADLSLLTAVCIQGYVCSKPYRCYMIQPLNIDA